MTRRSLLLAIRQHHGIEHATLTLLSRRAPGTRVFAHSDPWGFVVFGDVPTSTLRAAAEEALARLQHGESALAVHPHCGTNLVMAGILSGAAALAAGSGRNRPWWDRLAGAILGATLASLAAAPLGRWAQARITTSPAVAGLRITSVTQLAGPATSHRVAIG